VRRLARNGFEAWSEVVAHDYEGLVAKDEASLYEAGADPPLAEGQTEGLDGPRRSLATADQRPRRPMTLLSDLQAFLQEHRYCGEMDAAVEGDRIWMTCTCGARIERDADRD
jgi:hypothetical protein